MVEAIKMNEGQLSRMERPLTKMVEELEDLCTQVDNISAVISVKR